MVLQQENWAERFKEKPDIGQMSVVMIHHHVSIEDLSPYFEHPNSLSLCRSKLLHCQRVLPLLLIEEFKGYEDLKKNHFSIFVNFNTDKAQYCFNDFLLIEAADMIIDDMYGEKANQYHLTCIFEEKDYDGATQTQWEAINLFLSDSNMKIKQLLKEPSFKLDFRNAYRNYFIQKTKDITQQVGIPFDGKITPIT